jgi:rhodanese-related sulfurtransferase
MNKIRVAVIAGFALAVVMVVGVAVWLSGASSSAASALITPAEYQSQFISSGADHMLIDVRTTQEYAGGHIAGSVNIALDTIASRLNDIPRDQPVVLYCRSGNRSAQAARILAEAGYTNVRDLGGIIAWTAQGYPVE